MKAIDANHLAKTYRTKMDYDVAFAKAMEDCIFLDIKSRASMGNFELNTSYYHLAQDSKYPYPTTNALERTEYCSDLRQILIKNGYACEFNSDHKLRVSW